MFLREIVRAPALCDLSLSRYQKQVVAKDVVLQDYYEIVKKCSSFSSFFTDERQTNIVVEYSCVDPYGPEVREINSTASVELHRLFLDLSVVLEKVTEIEYLHALA